MLDAAVKVAFETGRFLLKLKEKGIIQGKIFTRGGSGSPAGGATLLLYDFSREEHILRTTSALGGRYAFGEVRPGSYRIDVNYGSYAFTDMERLYFGKGKDLFIEIKLPIFGGPRTQPLKIREEDVGLYVITDKGLLKPTHKNYKYLLFPHLGVQYSIRVTNKTNSKLLAVVTVDGLSVMNGEPGDYYSGGYVISPGSEVNIPGWRIDDNSVARFVFLQKDKSYAGLMHKPTNIGIIACAFFEEEDRTGVLESRALGTGFGEATEHRVKRVAFNREAAPSVIKRIYYTATEEQAESVDFNPNPFPGCKPPPGWNSV